MREFHLSLEFKLLEVQEEAAAVAVVAAAAEGSDEAVVVDAAVAAKMHWSWTGLESVYPYWVVTRCSLAEMRRLQAAEEASTLRFNMAVLDQQYANVTVGKYSNTMTSTVMVPVLTNTVKLRQGEQLCLEVVPKETSRKRKVSTWKTDVATPKRAPTQTAVAVREAGKQNSSHGRQTAVCIKVDANVDI